MSVTWLWAGGDERARALGFLSNGISVINRADMVGHGLPQVRVQRDYTPVGNRVADLIEHSVVIQPNMVRITFNAKGNGKGLARWTQPAAPAPEPAAPAPEPAEPAPEPAAPAREPLAAAVSDSDASK